MDAYDIAEDFGISLKKAQKIARAVSLQIGRKHGLAAKMRVKLSKDEQLSVMDLLALLNDGALFRKFGKFENRARAQTYALGYVRASAAPVDVTRHIADAAAGHPESVVVVLRWLKSVIPRWPVRFHWIAIRLLINRWPYVSSRDTLEIEKALRNVRAHPEFTGWFGKRPVGRWNPMFYHQPKLVFDL